MRDLRLREPAPGSATVLEHIEPRIRGLTVAALGIDPEDLGPDVSLTDDLAADSLDLLELALVLEGEFQIVMPEAAIDEVRTYRDLVRVVGTSVAAAHERTRHVLETPPIVRTRVVSRVARGSTERATELTPYAAEEIAADALSAGPGAALDIVVRSANDEGAVAGVDRVFAWLRGRGVTVLVTPDRASVG